MLKKKNREELLSSLESFDQALFNILKDDPNVKQYKFKMYIAGGSSLLLNNLLERNETKDIDYTSPNMSALRKVEVEFEKLNRIYDLQLIPQFDYLIYHFEEELIFLEENKSYSIIEVYTLTPELSALMKLEGSLRRYEKDFFDITSDLMFEALDIDKLTSMVEETIDANIIPGFGEFEYRIMRDNFNGLLKKYKEWKEKKA